MSHATTGMPNLEGAALDLFYAAERLVIAVSAAQGRGDGSISLLRLSPAVELATPALRRARQHAGPSLADAVRALLAVLPDRGGDASEAARRLGLAALARAEGRP